MAKSEKEGPIKNRFEIQQNKIIQGITKETSRRSVISFMGEYIPTPPSCCWNQEKEETEE